MKQAWKFATGVAIIAIIGLGGLYLYLGEYEREYEPDRTRFPVRGIDVSHHQGTIDWTAVAADDVAFAYVKVSEGGDHRDRESRRNIAEANRLGLPVGAYHFFTFCRPGADQATNFLDALAGSATQLPPMVDLEFEGNCERRPTPAEMRRDVEIFLSMVESGRGDGAIYYVPDSFLAIYGEALPPRPLWRRSIMREPDRLDWAIWQYHPAGRVAGIDGDVDLNVLAGGLDDLTALGGPYAGGPAGSDAQP
jgi:lysozyme